MALTSWASRWCVAGADNLQQVDKMCMRRSAVGGILHYGPSCGACVGMHYGESSLHNYGTQQSFPTDFPLLIAQNFHIASVVQKTVQQVDAKATDTRTQSKVHGVSIDISAVVPWWRRQITGLDHHRWWNVGCTHYPRNQAAVNDLVS